MTQRSRLAARPGTVLLLLCVMALAAACGWSGWETPMTTVRPKSDFGKMTHDVFMLISWWTLGIFILVEALLVYVCWRFRDQARGGIPAQVHGHRTLEICWTAAFALILVVIGIPTVRVIFKTQEAPAATALRVDVAGRQWWWEFTYPGLKITTANEVHLPVGQPVAFALHAPDLVHSFWIPQLGGKRDVVPRRVNQLVMTPQTPGEYPGQCAEYCGESHANMRFRVFVHPKADFDRWVTAQLAPPIEPTDPVAQRGKELYGQSACVGCHAIAGISAGTLGPSLTHFGSRTRFAGGVYTTTRENLVKWIENPGRMKPGALMPNLGLKGEQADAIAAYLLSLK